MSIFQSVDVTPFASTIDVGDRYVDLSFAYNAADSQDLGVVSMSFLDSLSAPLGSDVTFLTSSQPTASGVWETASLFGAVPAGTRSIRFSLAGESIGSGTARNVNFDSLSATANFRSSPSSTRRREWKSHPIHGQWSLELVSG